MNKKKIAIISSILILLVVVSGVVYFILNRQDKNTTLTILEKQWIEKNKNTVIDLSILNNIPIISYSGEGVFFDFLSSLQQLTGLEFNKVSYNVGEMKKSDYALEAVNEVNDNDIVIYRDYYAVLTKKSVKYEKLTDMQNMTIGVLKNQLDIVNEYLLGANVTYKSFDSIAELIDAIKDDSQNNVDAIVLPKMMYFDKIVMNENLNIAYNITEYSINYILTLGKVDKLNTIIKKYYNKWSNNNYTDSYNKHFSNNYFDFKQMDDKEIVKFRSKRYTYGYVLNAPYHLEKNNELAGLNYTVLKNFANISDLEINYKQYSTISDLIEDFNNNNVDFIFQDIGSFNYKMDVIGTVDFYQNNSVIVSKINNPLLINSIHSLKKEEVSVVRDSKIAQYLINNNISIKPYNTMEEMVEQAKDSSILAMDEYNYDYYVRSSLAGFKKDFTFSMKSPYQFLIRDIKDNKVFTEFFNFYLSFIPTQEIINESYDNIIIVDYTPVVLKRVLIIVGVIFVIGGVIFLAIMFNPKKIIKKKKSLSKEEKLKYIDLLTSLKNRNYLNDNLEKWDDSEIYPQTIIIVDLNNVAYINDNYGHAEGDKVITDAANILIKNQLPNSEIIRTNGNEFLIYLVEYDEKQVVSYIRKLNKEFKELSHGFGAAIGYSMIVDAIKTIDDAVNEATLDMRSNKEEANN